MNPARTSYEAIHRLRSRGHDVFAFGLKEGTVYDVDIQKSTDGIDEFNPDTITMYMNAKRQEEFYDVLLNSGAKRVIFNPGAENEELERLLFEKGIEPVNACTLVMLAVGNY